MSYATASPTKPSLSSRVAFLKNRPKEPQHSTSSSHSSSTQYPTPPPTHSSPDPSAAPRGQKRKIKNPPPINTSNSHHARGRKPPSATQTSPPANSSSVTRLPSSERSKRHNTSEEKRRKEIELERLRLSRLVPDALDSDRSEDQILAQTLRFVHSQLQDRARLVSALESRGIQVGTGDGEGGLGREIWEGTKLMEELAWKDPEEILRELSEKAEDASEASRPKKQKTAASEDGSNKKPKHKGPASVDQDADASNEVTTDSPAHHHFETETPFFDLADNPAGMDEGGDAGFDDPAEAEARAAATLVDFEHFR